MFGLEQEYKYNIVCTIHIHIRLCVCFENVPKSLNVYNYWFTLGTYRIKELHRIMTRTTVDGWILRPRMPSSVNVWCCPFLDPGSLPKHDLPKFLNIHARAILMFTRCFWMVLIFSTHPPGGCRSSQELLPRPRSKRVHPISTSRPDRRIVM